MSASFYKITFSIFDHRECYDNSIPSRLLSRQLYVDKPLVFISHAITCTYTWFEFKLCDKIRNACSLKVLQNKASYVSENAV